MSDDEFNKPDDSGKLLYCSFCAKSQQEVKKLIAGPSVFVCDECVELCNDIIKEEVQERESDSKVRKLPVPKEIKETFPSAMRWQDVLMTTRSFRSIGFFFIVPCQE